MAEQALSGSQGLDGSRQAALVASSFILVDDVFVGHAIDDAASFVEDFVGGSLVAGGDSLANALDGRAQHGAQAGVMFVAGNRLTGALTSLG